MECGAHRQQERFTSPPFEVVAGLSKISGCGSGAKNSIFAISIICKKTVITTMGDIIWGNGSSVLSASSFVLSVTHRKNGNRGDYADTEKIIVTSADLPGMPRNMADWTQESLGRCVVDAFLKCEVEQRDESGTVVGKVSHSGAGGY